MAPWGPHHRRGSWCDRRDDCRGRGEASTAPKICRHGSNCQPAGHWNRKTLAFNSNVAVLPRNHRTIFTDIGHQSFACESREYRVYKYNGADRRAPYAGRAQSTAARARCRGRQRRVSRQHNVTVRRGRFENRLGGTTIRRPPDLARAARRAAVWPRLRCVAPPSAACFLFFVSSPLLACICIG